MLRQDGWTPDEKTGIKKMMLWGSVQMNTLMNTSTQHMAEMMINGTTMGIIDMTKKIHQLPDADKGARELAEEFISGEQQNIEDLKAYL